MMDTIYIFIYCDQIDSLGWIPEVEVEVELLCSGVCNVPCFSNYSLNIFIVEKIFKQH